MSVVLVVMAGVALFVLGSLALVLLKIFYRPVQPGQALVVTDVGGGQRVTLTGALVLPVIHRADLLDITTRTVDVDLDGARAPRSRDGVPVAVRAVAYLRILPEPQSVLDVARSFGCARASDLEEVRLFFRPRIIEALRGILRERDFEDLLSGKDDLGAALITRLGPKLRGFTLDNVAFERLDRATRDGAEIGPFR